jgi:hypothetical protein
LTCDLVKGAGANVEAVDVVEALGDCFSVAELIEPPEQPLRPAPITTMSDIVTNVLTDPPAPSRRRAMLAEGSGALPRTNPSTALT